ncbi:MAG TPA: M20/M25/M40 family metallo-hydrolase [Clostridia bacterium]|nr:M20/M25/M40 family metallo-hydrolase [Clostridia bacterium]
MREALRLLERYVSLPSGPWAKADAEKLTQAVREDFEALGLSVTSIPCEKVGPVLECRWGHGPKRLLLMGHLDTVFPREECQPFRLEGNRVHGSGVTDMKGGVVIMHQALEAVLNCDEELGSPESGQHILRNAKECFAVLSFEPCRVGGGLVCERKGVTSFELKCTGIRGHAGAAYKQCASAIQELCARVTELYTLRDDDRDISLNIGVIQGGTAENVVADEASLRGEFRYYDQNYQAMLMDRIRAICDKPGVPGTTTTLAFGAAHPALRRNERSLELMRMAQEIAREDGRELHEESTGGAGDIAIAGLAGIPCLDGLGLEGEGVHTIQEVGYIDSMEPQIKLAEKLMLKLLA